MCCTQLAFNTPHFAQYSALFPLNVTLYSSRRILNITHDTLSYIGAPPYTTNCPPQTAHCTLYTARRTLYTFTDCTLYSNTMHNCSHNSMLFPVCVTQQKPNCTMPILRLTLQNTFHKSPLQSGTDQIHSHPSLFTSKQVRRGTSVGTDMTSSSPTLPCWDQSISEGWERAEVCISHR